MTSLLENPHERSQELQAIQDEIIAFIKAHTENGREDDLAKALRLAVSELNVAKGIIWDRAVEAGIYNPEYVGELISEDAKTS